MSYVVEEIDPLLLKKFREKLVELGFEDFHSSAIATVCKSLKDLLGLDLMKTKSFTKKCFESSRPSLLINTKAGVIIMIGEVQKTKCVKGKAFEVTCFSKSRDEVYKMFETAKDLLTKELGFPSTIVHEGSFDENCNRNLMKTLSETPRSELVRKVKGDVVGAFLNRGTKEKLRFLTTLPIKMFHKAIMDFNPDILVPSGIMTETFAPNCRKCGIGSLLTAAPYVFNSQKDVSAILKLKSIACPHCGNRLNSENATIESFYQFTDLGRECSKGLWLESYTKNILEEIGVSEDRIKLCSVHGTDEIDIVFSEGDSLFICECRDRVFGQNDLYVLAMKVRRINDDRETPALADKVLIISTESIPKDILMTSRREKIEYIPATGNPEEIKKELVKAVKRARQKYLKKRLRELSEILLWFLPSVVEDAYMRRFVEEEEEFPL